MERIAMSEWDNPIIQYLAAAEGCETRRNIFARLNMVRCEFAIRNGRDGYIALHDDGSKKMVQIYWHYFETQVFNRACGPEG
jgi:hypothetical protein